MTFEAQSAAAAGQTASCTHQRTTTVLLLLRRLLLRVHRIEPPSEYRMGRSLSLSLAMLLPQ
jgi:hypothetical protein